MICASDCGAVKLGLELRIVLTYSVDLFAVHSPKEGWVSIPNKQNIKRYGWKRQVSLNYPTCLYFSVPHTFYGTRLVVTQLSPLILPPYAGGRGEGLTTVIVPGFLFNLFISEMGMEFLPLGTNEKRGRYFNI